jgi:hypothetical protein
MKTLYVVLTLLVVASISLAQTPAPECSAILQRVTGGTTYCNMPGGNANPPPWQEYPAGGTQVVQDACMNDNNNVWYFNVSSSVATNGQCAKSGCSIANGCQPAGVYTCPGQYEIQSTHALNPQDYDRFYNRAYDVDQFAYSNVAPSQWSCPRTGAWRQDFQQCGGITCPSM